MNEADDILIQRCIDNELSASERRELLSKLDAMPGGWKSLACGFVEDQLFAVAATGDSAPVGTSAGAIKPMPQKGHWFNHTLTSLVLSVCVAFLAGILIRGGLNSNDSSLPVVQSDSPVSPSNDIT